MNEKYNEKIKYLEYLNECLGRQYDYALIVCKQLESVNEDLKEELEELKTENSELKERLEEINKHFEEWKEESLVEKERI